MPPCLPVERFRRFFHIFSLSPGSAQARKVHARADFRGPSLARRRTRSIAPRFRGPRPVGPVPPGVARRLRPRLLPKGRLFCSFPPRRLENRADVRKPQPGRLRSRRPIVRGHRHRKTAANAAKFGRHSHRFSCAGTSGVSSYKMTPPRRKSRCAAATSTGAARCQPVWPMRPRCRRPRPRP